ncbi:GIY-YIG nuclease family protein [Salinibius halmophilus]|uniref:GIY-YIG nuclease family protein n=1 Tax=Salinibius halmophilus TaxID=1853216 RepID=UPI000E667967|nr:GIY-YIG nuclease family protein [Salinibius halmophilus]
MKVPSVYILASKKNGTLYVGVTSDPIKRMWQHKSGYFSEGFTSKYGCELLVYIEHHECIESAIAREKQLKKWNRAWKISLIEANNPEWQDLSTSLLDH